MQYGLQTLEGRQDWFICLAAVAGVGGFIAVAFGAYKHGKQASSVPQWKWFFVGVGDRPIIDHLTGVARCKEAVHTAPIGVQK